MATSPSSLLIVSNNSASAYSFQFNTLSTLSLSNWSLAAVVVSNAGDLWCVGTAHNIAVWQSGWVPSVGDNVFVSLAFDAADTMWSVNTSGSVAQWNGKSWTPAPDYGSTLLMLTFDRTGTAWSVGTDNNVYSWQNTAWAQLSGAGDVVMIDFDSSNTMWAVTTANTVVQWVSGGWVTIPLPTTAPVVWLNAGIDNPGTFDVSILQTACLKFFSNITIAQAAQFAATPVATLMANGVDLSTLTNEQLAILNDSLQPIALAEFEAAKSDVAAAGGLFSACSICKVLIKIVLVVMSAYLVVLSAGIAALALDAGLVAALVEVLGVSEAAVVSGIEQATGFATFYTVPNWLCSLNGTCNDPE